MPFWNTSSTTLANDVTYVNNTYKGSDGKNNALSTITKTNPTGYVPVNNSSNDPIVKKLSYAVQNDGKITYQYDDGTGNKIKYNSIQEIANDFGISGYSAATTAQIKSAMQNELKSSATAKKVGPTVVGQTPASNTGAGTTAAASPNITDATVGEKNKAAGTDDGLPGAGALPLIYPIGMNPKQDKIIFTMQEYSPKALVAGATGTTGEEQDTGNPLKLGSRSSNRKNLGKVVLPIQSGIMDGNAAAWGEDNMNALDLVKINAMKAGITGGVSAAADVGQQAAAQAPEAMATEKGAIANLITQAATGGNVLGRAEGSAVNNNLELLFTGPSLRSFNFTFKMSARSKPEAKLIANIIRFFKQGMAPKRTATAYFLKAPNTFMIEYRHGSLEHPGLNKIKECALNNMQVNYTPDGYYAAHTDGYLVSYEMTLSFQELEPVYNDEYASFKDVIGY